MSEATTFAAIYFEAAMCVSTGRKQTARSAMFEAGRYLGLNHSDIVGAMRNYEAVFGRTDSDLVFLGGWAGRRWLHDTYKQWLILMLLMAYEYTVVEMRAERQTQHEAHITNYIVDCCSEP